MPGFPRYLKKICPSYYNEVQHLYSDIFQHRQNSRFTLASCHSKMLEVWVCFGYFRRHQIPKNVAELGRPGWQLEKMAEEYHKCMTGGYASTNVFLEAWKHLLWGWLRSLTLIMVQTLCGHLLEKPDLQLYEMVEFVWDLFEDALQFLASSGSEDIIFMRPRRKRLRNCRRAEESDH